jgi:hypothetical protein
MGVRDDVAVLRQYDACSPIIALSVHIGCNRYDGGDAALVNLLKGQIARFNRIQAHRHAGAGGGPGIVLPDGVEYSP